MIGIYLVVLRLLEEQTLSFGGRPQRLFSEGYYVYVGSALGRTPNLEKRVARHRRLAQEKRGRPSWHIDLLLTHPQSRYVGEVLIPTTSRDECRVSKLLEGVAEETVAHFGSSDCKNGCRGHLHYFKKNPTTQIRGVLGLKTFNRRSVKFGSR